MRNCSVPGTSIYCMKQWSNQRCILGMLFNEVDDRCGVNKQPRYVLKQVGDLHRGCSDIRSLSCRLRDTHSCASSPRNG